MSESTEAARRLRAVLAAADGPVSIDALVASGLWTPGALWGLLEEARRDGAVAPDAGAGPGHVRWNDAARRGDAIQAARPEDLEAVLARPALAGLVLAGARAAARDRDFPRAAALYRALAAVKDPGVFPGGDATWLAAIIESIRLLRSGTTIAPA